MPGKLTQTFAENLRSYRRAIGISQLDLAKKAGLSWRYIGVLERAVRCPTLDTADALANALGVTLVQLLEFQKEKAPPSDAR
jgi:transcriptional regulator with XRE-family HTH domain